MNEPDFALYAAQPATGTVLTNVAQLRTQGLHACEAVCGLGLKILKVGERGKEWCCATRDLVHEMLLDRISVMRELFE
jgi:hypothetical protein